MQQEEVGGACVVMNASMLARTACHIISIFSARATWCRGQVLLACIVPFCTTR